MRVPALKRPLLLPVTYCSLFAAVISVYPFTPRAAAAQSPAAQDPSTTAPSAALRQLAAATSPFALPPQQDHPGPSRLAPAASREGESSSLPEAPEPAIQPATQAGAHTAPIYEKEIPAGWQAQPLSARDKVILGLRDLYTPGNFGSMFISSGYSQLTNRQPNYGTDRGAYGERLGASALRETSQGFFTDAVFAPLLHQDPRYYVLGPQYGTFHRAFYALTRPLVRRTDDGHTTINSSLLLGYASAAALTNAYYPGINRNAHDTTATFGASIGGAALGFLVSEYTDQILVATHLRRPE